MNASSTIASDEYGCLIADGSKQLETRANLESSQEAFTLDCLAGAAWKLFRVLQAHEH